MAMLPAPYGKNKSDRDTPASKEQSEFFGNCGAGFQPIPGTLASGLFQHRLVHFLRDL